MKRMTFENTLYLFVFVIKRQDPPRLLLYNNDMKHMKCNRCEVGNLRRHLKTHSGEKSNKCNQCDFQTLPRVKNHKLSLLSVFKLLWILSKLGSSRPSVAGLLRWLRPLHPKGAQAARYRLNCAWGKSCFRTCEQNSLFSLFDVKIRYNFYHHKITFSSFKHGDKLNKCNQCDSAYTETDDLRRY